mgnify:FL=1
MLEINQISPDKIIQHKAHLEDFLKDELTATITNKSWMTEWKMLARRFQLLKFKEMNNEDIRQYEWDPVEIESIIRETISEVRRHIPIDNLQITIVPAIEFQHFKYQPQSLWTNAFTNSPGRIVIAVPPRPDKDFLQYLLAHETHHAYPENPIYRLTLEQFSLIEWFKMEGTAEYFSLSLYPDKRWWRDNLPPEVEKSYWEQVKNYLYTTDDQLKSQLCFGSKEKGIPIFAGYSFALQLVNEFVQKNGLHRMVDLYDITTEELIANYR